MARRTNYQDNQTGFTIVELLIATSVFSVVLLIVTTGVMAFTKAYYRGVTMSTTQNTAREILNTFGQAIQFSGSENGFIDISDPGSKGYCINNQRYSFVLHRQLAASTPTPPGQSPHVLIQDGLPLCSASTNPLNVTASMSMAGGKTEMMGAHMRLANLEITPVGNPSNKTYFIRVVVAYGDDDLLDNPNSTTPKCKNQEGSQFCAVSSLSVVVKQRL